MLDKLAKEVATAETKLEAATEASVGKVKQAEKDEERSRILLDSHRSGGIVFTQGMNALNTYENWVVPAHPAPLTDPTTKKTKATTTKKKKKTKTMRHNNRRLP
jgi:hypothetical protein